MHRCRNDTEPLLAKREAFRRVRPKVVLSPAIDLVTHSHPNNSIQPRRIKQPLQPEHYATARTPARELRRRKKLFYVVGG